MSSDIFESLLDESFLEPKFHLTLLQSLVPSRHRPKSRLIPIKITESGSNKPIQARFRVRYNNKEHESLCMFT